MNVIIPLYLSEIKTDYIKGGKAYDFYFRNKTNSIDWDIVMTAETYQTLSNMLRTYGKTLEFELKEYNRGELSMIQLSFEKKDTVFYYDDTKDKFFMDCNISKDIHKSPIIWNNYRYMNMTHFVTDLIETLSDRYKKVMDKNKNILKNNKEEATKYNTLDKNKILFINGLLPLKSKKIKIN